MNGKRNNQTGMGGGKPFPCLCISNLTPEDAESILTEITEQIRRFCGMDATEGTKSPMDAECGTDPEKGFEGDGEEVFGQMMDDLLYMAALVDAMYSTMHFLSEGRIGTKQALGRGKALMQQADSVLEKWQRYALPEA